jgi:hypothetical protein
MRIEEPLLVDCRFAGGLQTDKDDGLSLLPISLPQKSLRPTDNPRLEIALFYATINRNNHPYSF